MLLTKGPAVGPHRNRQPLLTAVDRVLRSPDIEHRHESFIRALTDWQHERALPPPSLFEAKWVLRIPSSARVTDVSPGTIDRVRDERLGCIGGQAMSPEVIIKSSPSCRKTAGASLRPPGITRPNSPAWPSQSSLSLAIGSGRVSSGEKMG